MTRGGFTEEWHQLRDCPAKRGNGRTFAAKPENPPTGQIFRIQSFLRGEGGGTGIPRQKK